MLQLYTLHDEARSLFSDEVARLETARSQSAARSVIRAAAMLERIECVRFDAIMRRAYA